jgi:hypothetical protein
VPVRAERFGWHSPALLTLGTAYALVAAATQPFSWQADLMTAVPVAALAVGAIVFWPRHPATSEVPGRRHPYRPWVAALVVVVTWELVNDVLPGARGEHPTLSSMLNAVDRHYALKVFVFLAWLSLGWTVFRLGRTAQQ